MIVQILANGGALAVTLFIAHRSSPDGLLARKRMR